MIATAEHPRPCGFARLLHAVREEVAVANLACQSTTLEPFGGKAWFTGRCPLPDHEDRTPSFYIYPADHPGGRWYCYGCSRGGDVLDLYMSIRGLDDYKGALMELAGEYAILDSMPDRPANWHKWNGEKARWREKLRDVLAASYRRRIFRLYREYLAGISDAEEREEEARLIWSDLAGVSRMCAEYRISQKEPA